MASASEHTILSARFSVDLASRFEAVLAWLPLIRDAQDASPPSLLRMTWFLNRFAVPEVEDEYLLYAHDTRSAVSSFWCVVVTDLLLIFQLATLSQSRHSHGVGDEIHVAHLSSSSSSGRGSVTSVSLPRTEWFLLFCAVIVVSLALVSLSLTLFLCGQGRRSRRPTDESRRSAAFVEVLLATVITTSTCVTAYLAPYDGFLLPIDAHIEPWQTRRVSIGSASATYSAALIIATVQRRPRACVLVPCIALSVVALVIGATTSTAIPHFETQQRRGPWPAEVTILLSAGMLLAVCTAAFRGVTDRYDRRQFKHFFREGRQLIEKIRTYHRLLALVENFSPALLPTSQPGATRGDVDVGETVAAPHRVPLADPVFRFKAVVVLFDVCYKELLMLPRSDVELREVVATMQTLEQGLWATADAIALQVGYDDDDGPNPSAGGSSTGTRRGSRLVERVVCVGDGFCCVSGVEHTHDVLGSRTLNMAHFAFCAVQEAETWIATSFGRSGKVNELSSPDDNILAPSCGGRNRDAAAAAPCALRLKASLACGPVHVCEWGSSVFQYSVAGEAYSVARLVVDHADASQLVITSAALEACGPHNIETRALEPIVVTGPDGDITLHHVFIVTSLAKSDEAYDIVGGICEVVNTAGTASESVTGDRDKDSTSFVLGTTVAPDKSLPLYTASASRPVVETPPHGGQTSVGFDDRRSPPRDNEARNGEAPARQPHGKQHQGEAERMQVLSRSTAVRDPTSSSATTTKHEERHAAPSLARKTRLHDEAILREYHRAMMSTQNIDNSSYLFPQFALQRTEDRFQMVRRLWQGALRMTLVIFVVVLSAITTLWKSRNGPDTDDGVLPKWLDYVSWAIVALLVASHLLPTLFEWYMLVSVGRRGAAATDDIGGDESYPHPSSANVSLPSSSNAPQDSVVANPMTTRTLLAVQLVQDASLITYLVFFAWLQYCTVNRASREAVVLLISFLLVLHYSVTPLRTQLAAAVIMVIAAAVTYTVVVNAWTVLDVVILALVPSLLALQSHTVECTDRDLYRDTAWLRSARTTIARRQKLLGAVLRSTIPRFLQAHHHHHQQQLQSQRGSPSRPLRSKLNPCTDVALGLFSSLMVCHVTWTGLQPNFGILERLDSVDVCLQHANAYLDRSLLLRRPYEGRKSTSVLPGTQTMGPPTISTSALADADPQSRFSLCLVRACGASVTVVGCPGGDAGHLRVGAFVLAAVRFVRRLQMREQTLRRRQQQQHVNFLSSAATTTSGTLPQRTAIPTSHSGRHGTAVHAVIAAGFGACVYRIDEHPSAITVGAPFTEAIGISRFLVEAQQNPQQQQPISSSANGIVAAVTLPAFNAIRHWALLDGCGLDDVVLEEEGSSGADGAALQPPTRLAVYDDMVCRVKGVGLAAFAMVGVKPIVQ